MDVGGPRFAGLQFFSGASDVSVVLGEHLLGQFSQSASLETIGVKARHRQKS